MKTTLLLMALLFIGGPDMPDDRPQGTFEVVPPGIVQPGIITFNPDHTFVLNLSTSSQPNEARTGHFVQDGWAPGWYWYQLDGAPYMQNMFVVGDWNGYHWRVYNPMSGTEPMPGYGEYRFIP